MSRLARANATIVETARRLDDRRVAVWAVAVVAYGVGDLATTWYGLRTGAAREVGPLAAPLLAGSGLAGMVALKVASLVLIYAVWRATPRPVRVGSPLALVACGVAVTAWNLAMLS